MAPQEPEEEGLSFLDHLEELRFRLMRCILALVVGVLVGWYLAPVPLEWMTYPLQQAFSTPVENVPVIEIEVGPQGELRLRDAGALERLGEDARIEFFRPGEAEAIGVWRGQDRAKLHYLRPMDSFVVQFKAALMLGLVMAMPVLIYQLWAFVAPGLMPSERRFAMPVVISGSLLFPTGAMFAYFLLEVTLRFLAQFTMASAVPFYDARAYLGFALTMMLAFGVVFEFPLLVVLATRAGLVSVEWLAERRRIIFVVLLAVSAIITPSGDPVTLLALAGPLYLLFEGALVVSRVLDRFAAREKQALADDDPEAAAH